MDKHLSIGQDRGRCPPVQIWVRWFHATFLSNPYQENSNCRRLAHTNGCDRNLPIRTQIQSLRMLDPLDGVPGALSPSLYLLWAALTQLAGVALEP
jgi:hypothetical protein